MSAPPGPVPPRQRPTTQLEQTALNALRVPLAPVGNAVQRFVTNGPDHSPLGRLYGQGAFAAGLPVLLTSPSSPMFAPLSAAAAPVVGLVGKRVFDGIVGERPGVWDDAIGTGIAGAGVGAGLGSIVPGIGTAIGGGLGFLGGTALGWLQGDGHSDEDDPRRDYLRTQAQILEILMSQPRPRPAARSPITRQPPPPAPPDDPLPPAARLRHIRVPLDRATMDAYAAQRRALAGVGP